MAKVDDLKPIDWDEPPSPLHERPLRQKFDLKQIKIRHIMFSLIYFAIVFWAIRQFIETRGELQAVIILVLVGLGLCGLGLWGAMRMTRHGYVGWTLFVVGYLMVTGGMTSFFAIPTVPILIGVIVYLSYRRRSNNQDALLWVLAVAAERKMPLAPGIHAFASQVTGIFEVWTESLASLLYQGVSLPDALDGLPKAVPRGSALLIRMGWESGNLGLGLRDAVEARTRRLPILRSLGARIGYLLWIIVVGLSIVSFIMYFIVPKFEAIMKDFGIEMPEVTRLVIGASHVCVESAWMLTPITFGLGIYSVFILMGSGGMTVPVIDRLLGRRHTVLILRCLAVVVEAGKPIPPAFFSLGQWYPTNWVRKKLARTALEAGEGRDWIEALRHNGLISSSDMGVLNSAQRAGNLAWALRELADTGERRLGYRLQAITQVLFVLAILALGGMVFVISMAYFAPLTTLIMRLTQ